MQTKKTAIKFATEVSCECEQVIELFVDSVSGYQQHYEVVTVIPQLILPSAAQCANYTNNTNQVTTAQSGLNPAQGGNTVTGGGISWTVDTL